MRRNRTDPMKSGVWPAYREPTYDWKPICALVLVVLLYVGVMVFLVNR